MGTISTPKTRLYIAEERTEQTTVAGYDGLTWTGVGRIVDLGELGPEFKAIETEFLDDGLVHRLKGSLDFGQVALKLGRDPDNAGQSAILEGLDDYENFNFKIEFNNKPAGVGAKPTRLCFPAKIMSYKTGIGSGSKLVEASVNLAIDGAVLEGARGT